MIACVSVVGRANNPLYLRSFNSQTDELKFHFIVHTSLDIIDERITNRPNKEVIVDSCLGFLYQIEDFKVYGYVTTTNVKLIIVVDEYSDIKDPDVKIFFDKFYNLYISTISNPFYNFDEEITSKKFELEVAHLVALNSN